MTEVKNAHARTTLAPLPETKRGFGIFIDTHPKDKRLVYTSGSQVIVRSLEDPSVSDLFNEHRGVKVNVAKFSPNGEWIASGDDRGRVLIWGAKNKIIKNDLLACRRVLDISWSADGQRLVAVGEGTEAMGRAFPWDSQNSLGDISGHSKAILTCAFRPNRPFKVVTGSEDNQVNLHQGPPFKFQSSFKEHTRFPNCIRYSSDGAQFVSVGADSKIYLFDGVEGTKIREFESKDGHKGSIYSATWSPDNKQLLTASGDKTAKLWDVASGACIKTFTFGNAVDDMQVSTGWCESYVLTVSLSGAINYLDLDNPAKPKLVVQGHQLALTCLEVDQSTKTVFSADSLGQVAQWNLGDGSIRARWFTGKGHGNSVQALGFNHDSVITAGYDDKVRLNSRKDGTFSDNAFGLPAAPQSLAVAHLNPQLVVVGVASNKIVVLKAGNVVHTTATKYRPGAIAISFDDTEVAVAGDDKKVHVYSLVGDALAEKKTLTEHQTEIWSVAYSPDGRFLASGDGGRFLWVRDRKADFAVKNPLGWQYHEAKVTSLQFSPDSKLLLSASQDQSVVVWKDLVEFDGTKRVILCYTHAETVYEARWVDGATVVSTGGDRAVKVWDLTGRL